MIEKKATIVSASPKTRKFARELGIDLHLFLDPKEKVEL